MFQSMFMQLSHMATLASMKFCTLASAAANMPGVDSVDLTGAASGAAPQFQTTGNQLVATAQSGMGIVTKICMTAAVLSIILAGVMMAFSNAGNRSESKSKIVWALVGLVFVFGAIGIAGFIQSMSQGMFTSGS